MRSSIEPSAGMPRTMRSKERPTLENDQITKANTTTPIVKDNALGRSQRIGAVRSAIGRLIFGMGEPCGPVEEGLELIGMGVTGFESKGDNSARQANDPV